MRRISLVVVSLLLAGCLGMPKQVTPIAGFNLDRYLGVWYEVARLDHSFERGLNQVTAEYSLRADGGVRVVNRGYSEIDGEWQEAEGKAFFVEDPATGYLKVSFFGPFYGSYVIFEIDRQDYQYAFVSGPSHDFLWLLSRKPNPGPEVLARFMESAEKLGFDSDALIFVEH